MGHKTKKMKIRTMERRQTPQGWQQPQPVKKKEKPLSKQLPIYITSEVVSHDF